MTISAQALKISPGEAVMDGKLVLIYACLQHPPLLMLSLVYSLSFLHPTPPPSSGIIFSDFSVLYCFPSRQYHFIFIKRWFTFKCSLSLCPENTLLPQPSHLHTSLLLCAEITRCLEFSPYPNTHCWTTTVNTSEKASFLLLSFT